LYASHKKQIERKNSVIVLRLRVRIGVRDNRCRHVRRSGLVQSLKSESVTQVCSRKARGPENLLRRDRGERGVFIRINS
jgi:hypothetical protein